MAEITDTTLKGADGFEMYAARASAVGPRKGGVVVIQEIFGVTPHIKEITSFFADNGYDAIAPSLYDRVEPRFFVDTNAPDAIDKGRKGAMGTPLPQAQGDIQAAINALGAGPIYITGFCYGGAMSWMAAQRCTGLTAASGFYGGMITQMLTPPPKVPIILHYGAQDAHIPPAAIDQVRAAAPDVPTYVYDAGHGFCRRGSSDFHEASATLGLQRTLDWFAEHR